MAEETKDNQPDLADPEAEDQQEDNLPENKVNVEDVGTLKKKITVTISQEKIEAKRNEMFGELSGTAQIPGFRVGRAPRRLIEKRFGKEVTQDVRNAIIGESIGHAIEKSELQTLGEPDLDLESIELPEAGDFEFSFETEVAPAFDLPELAGIKVEKPVIQITDKLVEQHIEEWAGSQATYEKTDEPAQAEDMVTAGAKISVEGQDAPVESPGLNLRVAPGQIEGLPLLELGNVLAGAKAGDTVELKATVNQAHPNEQWRGKEATIEITISQVQRRVVPKIDDQFAKAGGFESLPELREFLRDRAQTRLKVQVERAMRQSVEEHLLNNTSFDLPEGVVLRHTDSLVRRRYVSLLEQGIPRERIDQQLTELQAAAGEQASRDLKLGFILAKIAEAREITTSPDEVNSRVAHIAGLYGRRPERLRQELASDGSLQQLETSLLEEKVVDSLLAQAEITEVQPEQEAEEGEKKTAKKAKKKASTKSQAKSKAQKTEKKD